MYALLLRYNDNMEYIVSSIFGLFFWPFNIWASCKTASHTLLSACVHHLHFELQLSNDTQLPAACHATSTDHADANMDVTMTTAKT